VLNVCDMYRRGPKMQTGKGARVCTADRILPAGRERRAVLPPRQPLPV
jgi:hypothetical protein